MWKIGGEEVDTGTLKSVRPGKEITVSVEWKWRAERTPIEFLLDPEKKSRDEFEANNRRMIDSDAWLILIYIYRKTYDNLDSPKNFFGSYSFEDLIQAQIHTLNRKLAESKSEIAPEGCHARLAVGRFFVYKDLKEKKRVLDTERRLYDAAFSDHWVDADIIGMEKETYAAYVSMAHGDLSGYVRGQLGVVLPTHVYACNNAVAGDDGYPVRIGHDERLQQGEKAEHKLLLSDVAVAALNTQVDKRRGFRGDYMFAVPEKNYVRIVDNMGKPIPDAILRFYQSEAYSVPNRIVFAGRTDEDGMYLMPNRHAKVITTPNGFTQKANPFGEVQLNGHNSSMFLSITARGHTEYRWLDLSTLNRAWFAGKKDEAVYTYETSIGTEGAPKPPLLQGDFMTEEELYFSWHKYPNYWIEYFKLYSRKAHGSDLSFGGDTVDVTPFETVFRTQPRGGVWSRKLKIEDGYHEFYLTSVGDFERESSPSELFVAPSSRYRGNPVTVTVDGEGNVVYAAKSMSARANSWRIDNRRRFVSIFLSPPDWKFGGISDLIFHEDRFIGTCPTPNCILFYDRFGNGLFSLGERGSGPGEFSHPTGVAVHGNELYVCDTGNDRVQVFGLDDGFFIREFGGSGSGPGEFRSPSGIAVASDGTIAISDSGNNRVQLLTADGEFIKELTGLESPRGIDCFSDRFYIADTGNDRVVKTDKELNIVRSIEELRGKPLRQPMDVWVHQYPAEKRRRSFATLFIADHGSRSILDEGIPKDELEGGLPGRPTSIRRAVAYGTFFDLDDPDTALKPLQIVLFGLMDNVFFTREWTMKLNNVPPGLFIDKPETEFIVDEYFQAFVDFEVSLPETEARAAIPEGEDYALSSKGATAEGFARAELAIDGDTKDHDRENGYAHGIWKKPGGDALTIILKEALTLDRIDMLLWDKDARYYDYMLEVSSDGKTWTELSATSRPNVVRDIEARLDKFNPNDKHDGAAHIVLDYKTGHRGWTSHKISIPGKIKYLRLAGEYNSADSGFQVVEVEAWGPEGQ